MAPAKYLRLSLLRELVARRRWLAGIGIDLFGWILQMVALGLAPLTVVQPALSISLVFLLAAGSVFLGEAVGPREVASVGAIAAGVAVLGILAPDHRAAHAGGARLAGPLAALGCLALLPYAVPQLRRAGTAVAAGAGLAFAWDGLATKFAADGFTGRSWASFALWAVGMGVAAGVGTLAETSAFQRRPVTQVAPIVFGLTTVVPVALAPVVANERWSGSTATRAGLVAGIAAVLGGVIGVARSAAVEALLRRAARSSLSETG